MLRAVFAPALLILSAASVPAEDNKEPAKKPRVDLAGDLADESLAKEMPANGVIATEKGWEKLVKAWGIKDAPKVDFARELLIVGTWNGSLFNLRPVVRNGDLTVNSFGTQDLRPGFRWKVQSISREGVKTVQGKELPKE